MNSQNNPGFTFLTPFFNHGLNNFIKVAWLSSMLIVMFIHCTPSENFIVPPSKADTAANAPTTNSEPEDSPYTYSEAQLKTLPIYFKALYNNHKSAFIQTQQKHFEAFCSQFDLNPKDSSVSKAYFEIDFFHQIFTSSGASDGSKSGMLEIPYLWHWVTPNPRHTIIHLASGKPLTEIKPGERFNKYQSCADIDRTPSIFLEDLVSSKPQFYQPDCDTFYTFGWCSEREMAFVCLMETAEFGYTGKVRASGNHSWSELLIPLKNNKNELLYFQTEVDNTFDQTEWNKLDTKPISSVWLSDFGKGKLPGWYNLKAHSATEKKALQLLNVPPDAAKRIDSMVWNYIRNL